MTNELRKHRDLSEIVFGLVQAGDKEISPADVPTEVLLYPYNQAILDLPEANLAQLQLKYGTDPIHAAVEAAKRANGAAPREWLAELIKTYQDFKIVRVFHNVQKRLDRSEEVDYTEVKDAIDGRLAGQSVDPLPWSEITDTFDREWMWAGWIPHAEMTILVGQQGAGKSALALYLADCVANGKSLPDGSHVGRTYGVLWVETEGRHAENIRRARMWGIDQRNIYSPSQDMRRVLDLNQPEDKALVRAHAMRPEVGMVVIDSLGGALVEENDSSAKKTLKELSRMAQETNTTFLIIHHLRKPQKSGQHQAPTLDMVRGHSGITQFSPSVIVIDYSGNEMPRFLYHLKNNLQDQPKSLSFTIGVMGPVFNESIGDAVSRAATEDAMQWLKEQLRIGDMTIQYILEKATQEGIDGGTIRRAIQNPEFKMRTEGGVRYVAL